MKKQKGRVIPSDSEILRRLDKIEDKSTFFNLFFLFSFAFSMFIAVVAIAFALQNFEILLGALVLLIYAVVVFLFMVKHISSSKSNRKTKK